MSKQFITEAKRMQKLAGILINENKNAESEFGNAGFSFEDGVLGGVGSGGAGYYDFISDKISGFNLDKFDENEFNKWYDNFNINSFNSSTYDKEDIEANDIDLNQLMLTLGPGIYDIGELGYGGHAKIDKDGTITIYATPTLSDKDGMEVIPIFSLNNNGTIKPEVSKEEVKNKLKQNIQDSGAWGII